MSLPRRLTAVAAVAALAVTGVAGAAKAPVVSDQGTLANKRSPVTFPGTGVRKGERLPAGSRVVFRDVTLEGDQQARLVLRAGRDRVLRGLGTREGEDVGFTTVTGRPYVGRRQVRVRAYRSAEGEVNGRIYALTR